MKESIRPFLCDRDEGRKEIFRGDADTPVPVCQVRYWKATMSRETMKLKPTISVTVVMNERIYASDVDVLKVDLGF